MYAIAWRRYNKTSNTRQLMATIGTIIEDPVIPMGRIEATIAGRVPHHNLIAIRTENSRFASKRLKEENGGGNASTKSFC